MKRINAWSLDGGRVGLVIYDVRFSEVRRMPFADILFLSQKAFMPMVRLVLARYQHHAIQGCHLSPIVQADFVPLAPGRTVTVTRMGPASWGLTMRGDGYRTPDRSTSEVQAHIEVVEKALPEDTALCRPQEIPSASAPVQWKPGDTTGPARSASKTRISCLPTGGAAWSSRNSSPSTITARRTRHWRTIRA